MFGGWGGFIFHPPQIVPQQRWARPPLHTHTLIKHSPNIRTFNPPYTHASMHMHTHIHPHLHTHRHSLRQKNTHTHRQKHTRRETQTPRRQKHTPTQKDIEKHTHTDIDIHSDTHINRHTDTRTFDPPLQTHTHTQTALMCLIKPLVFLRSPWQQLANTPATQTHTHMRTHSHAHTRTYFYMFKCMAQQRWIIGSIGPAGGTGGLLSHLKQVLQQIMRETCS